MGVVTVWPLGFDAVYNTTYIFCYLKVFLFFLNNFSVELGNIILIMPKLVDAIKYKQSSVYIYSRAGSYEPKSRAFLIKIYADSWQYTKV